MDTETLIQPVGYQFPLEQHAINEEQTVSNFSNQVGGRAEMVTLNLGQEFAIGKPLNEAEYRFYETAAESLPVILLDFIPGYKGVVSIENGRPKVLRNKNKNKQKDSFGSCYIVLEDITSTFLKPSIMDLKMGTRQYSDLMPSDKIARKKQRSLDTTSNEYGLRIAGIRSYNVNESCSHYHMNKMEGRCLTGDTLLNAFRIFFSDGISQKSRVISVLLEKLTTIIEAVEKLNFRLYCCSLLLVYESDANEKIKTDIRIIDFAEFQARTGDGERYSGPDKGFLLGLYNLVKYLRILLQQELPINDPQHR